MSIKLQEFVARLNKRLKGVKRDELRHNLFFTDFRVRKGRRIGASRKQQLRHLVVFGRD